VTAPASRRAADNPFSAERIDALTLRPRGWTWDGLLARLEELDHRAAVVGPQGSGKTTLLIELERRVALATPRIRIDARDPRPVADAFRRAPPDAVAGRVVLVDGSERLGWFSWWRLRLGWRRAAGLVVTRHAPGRLPTLVEMRTDPALLRELVAELTPGEVDRMGIDLDGLFRRHRGDVRSCLRALYDLYADR